jgi:hypothetical protein
MVDVTEDAKFSMARPGIVNVSSTGVAVPAADGTTTITATHLGKTVTIPVVAERISESLPINFANQIVPIFTKLGCNSGGCHGKSGGQNGFRLSLLGFEPETDYLSLVKEGRGRRVFPAAPDKSLVLTKASGYLPHSGGKRLEPDSDEYKLLRRWVSAGMPYGLPTDPTVTKITVFPERRVLSRTGKQQFAVTAHYSDGSTEDVTRRAQYETNDMDVAAVNSTARVSALGMSGEAAIMVRYQGRVATFRATVPSGLSIPKYTFQPTNLVDLHTHNKWKELGLVPSEPCTDEQFIRRASLDITGTLPKPEDIRSFVTAKDPQKREALVDRLLDSEEYTYFFAQKWADVLRVKRRNLANRAVGTFTFHNWIRECIANDVPYDQFVRQILAATGNESRCPPVFWYSELTTPEQFVDDVAQVFLGTRINCAQCHHHPYEKWSQDDYWGMAAFFGRIGKKTVSSVGAAVQLNAAKQAIFNKPTGTVVNKRTNQPAEVRPLDGDVVKSGAEEDPRQKLVDWMVDPKNPFFARAVVNRYWAHFFGRGIVDPVDDMRATNPPSNPELLDALSQELLKNKFSLKHLIRTMCKSKTYQLSSTPNEFNKHDKQSYARYYPKRLGAEVIFDAVTLVTDSPTPFIGLPNDRHAPRRAIMLPDEGFQSYFLDVFGRPQRLSACECERVTEANLAQVLHMINSDEVHQKINRPGARADQMAKSTRPDEEKVEELFLLALGRKPTAKQLQLALDSIERSKANKQLAYEDIIWTLMNVKEFTFNQ